jgi:hypothetical protein
MKNLIVSSLAMATVAMLMSGCASVQRGIPSASGLVNINLEKGDYSMLGSVKGSSTLKSYFFGIVQIIDGNKSRILWVFKDYEDQYSFQDPGGLNILPVSVEDRAYYKALAATPDADAVIPKAFIKQSSGFPFIYEEQEVTFTGKALKYKSE